MQRPELKGTATGNKMFANSTILVLSIFSVSVQNQLKRCRSLTVHYTVVNHYPVKLSIGRNDDSFAVSFCNQVSSAMASRYRCIDTTFLLVRYRSNHVVSIGSCFQYRRVNRRDTAYSETASIRQRQFLFCFSLDFLSHFVANALMPSIS